jgi:Spy/CpxP family protein refolding chaperone
VAQPRVATLAAVLAFGIALALGGGPVLRATASGQTPLEHQHGPSMGPESGPSGTPASPYAAPWLEQAEIRALPPDEVAQIANGEGAGFAKAAELNGLPGPRHVLDIGDELRLTADQRVRTAAIFADMRAAALPAGQAYLDAQRALESDFRARAITAAALSARVAQVNHLRATLETVHLGAHLATLAVLSPEQTARYQQARGYSTE